MTDKPFTFPLSEAAERVREQLDNEQSLIRDDVAELLDDYDAVADVYLRVMKHTSASMQPLPPVSPAQLEHAAFMSSLEDACKYLQDLIGQTDDGVASDFFSQFADADRDWTVSTPKQRQDWLKEYLEEENFCASGTAC